MRQCDSLILIDKDNYEQLVKDEIDRTIKIREKELEERIANQKLKQRKKEEDLDYTRAMLRSDQKQEEILEEKHEIEIEKRHNQLSRKTESIRDKMRLLYKQENFYRDFLNDIPPHRIISMRNGELITTRHELYTKIGITPFSFENISYGYRLWLLEFDMDVYWDMNKFNSQDFYVRLQMLPNRGNFWKTSIAFGYVEYLHSLNNIQIKKVRPGHSPFLAMNLTLAPMYHSYLSVYGDFRKISLGLSNYAFYRHLNNNISFLLQIDFIMNEKFRNRYNDPVMFQVGVWFKPIENLNFTLAYEKHKVFTFSVGRVFGKTISRK